MTPQYDRKLISAIDSPTIPALVVSDTNAILLFDSTYRQIGSIQDPLGEGGSLAIDGDGDIYFESSDQYSQNLWIYAPPYTGTPKIVALAGVARGIAVDWRNEIVGAVADAPAPNANSYVYFFRHGASRPCATVRLPRGVSIDTFSSAFDAAGKLFTAFDVGGKAIVASISGECAAKTFVEYAPAQSYASFLQFNKENELVIDESIPFTQRPVYTFSGPSKGHLGKVSARTSLARIGTESVITDVLGGDGNSLYASDYTYGLALYRYPQGGAPSKILLIKNVNGVAVYPQLLP